jgi:ribose-phosphate pyrophosphokinase
MRDFCIFGGTSHPELTDQICQLLSVPKARSSLSKFSNQETNVKIDETVRDVNVFIVQSSCGNVNDNFMELLIMISACNTSSARKTTAVIPCFPYSRQKDSFQELESNSRIGSPKFTFKSNVSVQSLYPESTTPAKNGYKQWVVRPGNLIANMLATAGCDHVITMDLHDPQYQGFFDIPVDNLMSQPLIIK